MKCEIQSFRDGVLFFSCPECGIDLEEPLTVVTYIWSNHSGNSICPNCNSSFNIPTANEVDALKQESLKSSIKSFWQFLFNRNLVFTKKSFWQFPLLLLFAIISLLIGVAALDDYTVNLQRVFGGGFYSHTDSLLIMMGGSLLVGFVSALLIYSLFIHPIYQAFWFDEELRKKEPSSKSFKWGFYIGASAKRLGIFYTIILLLGGLGMMIGVGADLSEGNNEMAVVWAVSGVVWLLVGIYSGFVAVAGHFVIKRKKWALIVMTVLSGPIGWLINGIYISNRWDEFGSESKTDSPLPPYIPGKVCPYCNETIKMDATKCRYCHEWL